MCSSAWHIAGPQKAHGLGESGSESDVDRRFKRNAPWSGRHGTGLLAVLSPRPRQQWECLVLTRKYLVLQGAVLSAILMPPP